MPVLPAWGGFTTDYVAADELSTRLYNAANQTNNLSILNGGLDYLNYSVADESIPTWALQSGLFAAGAYVGFDRWEFTYAKQEGGKIATWTQFHAALTNRFFVPFDAAVILYGIQAFIRQDATYWSAGGGSLEYWQLRFIFDGAVETGMQCSLPHGRDSVSTPGTAMVPPGMHAENRWRYVTATGLLAPPTNSAPPVKNKGYRSLKVRIFGNIYAADIPIAKMITPSGGMWILCLR